MRRINASKLASLGATIAVATVTVVLPAWANDTPTATATDATKAESPPGAASTARAANPARKSTPSPARAPARETWSWRTVVAGEEAAELRKVGGEWMAVSIIGVGELVCAKKTSAGEAGIDPGSPLIRGVGELWLITSNDEANLARLVLGGPEGRCRGPL